MYNNRLWYVVLILFYVGLLTFMGLYYYRAQKEASLSSEAIRQASYAGSDWVTWKNAPNGVVAQHVHPLLASKPFPVDPIREGDRLRWIDFNHNLVYAPEVIDRITRAAPPGKVFIYQIERTDPLSLNVTRKNLYVVNGFQLAFSFDIFGAYWRLHSWLAGLGAFVSLVILAILLPVIRRQWTRHAFLLGVVLSALLLLFFQLLHQIFLIVESDLTSSRPEKVFILIYGLFLLAYSVFYFQFKGRVRQFLLALPSLVAALLLYGFLLKILLFDKSMGIYLEWVEQAFAVFFLWHITGTVALFLVDSWKSLSTRSMVGYLVVLILALGGTVFIALNPGQAGYEHALFGLQFMLLFPVVNATTQQMQFGKVSVVLTRTLQYIIVLLVSLVLYLLISQLYNFLLPNNPYSRLLEFITFIFTSVGAFWVYRIYQPRLTRYFTTSQQERLNRLRGFIARIPQFTSATQLEEELVREIRAYFRADPVQMWWPDREMPRPANLPLEAIYEQLGEHQTVWSRSKEIAGFRFDEELETRVLKSPFALICPVTIDEDSFAILLIGRKRRGVFNLSDLEMVSQLLQQTQLTLNVLQLNARERELIQQTYEANLTALRSQINPHFLFNTLNSIGELVHESAEKAEEAIEKLSFIFRYTLNVSSQNFVPLSKEMSLISTYLDLEKIRFADRLEVHIEVDPVIKEVPVPSLILQTLVENCIKHGVSKILDKGIISINARKQDDFLVCEVYDNGPGIDVSRIYKSTGLSNSIARLENTYQMKNLLQFENTGAGTLVTLKVPISGPPDRNAG